MVVNIFRLSILVFFISFVYGCSVVQATSGPATKDFSVLNKGTNRYRVIAELGKPVVSEVDEQDRKVDVFSFKQGTHGLVKTGKAIGYGVLAVGTLGLSELITSPIEGSINKGADMHLKVRYTKDELVDEVVVLKDDRWIPVQSL